MATFRMPALPKKIVLTPPKVDFVSESEGAEVSFKAIGLEALEENLKKLAPAVQNAAGYEMAKIAAEIIEDAKENYVPVDTGDLKASGDSDSYDETKLFSIIKIAMWFGGEVGPEALEHGVKDVRSYALEQHENLLFHHNVGGPKYLERPFLIAEPTMLKRIADACGIALIPQSPWNSVPWS